MKSTMVSVLMAVYNSELFVKEAIVSILEQSFTDFEFIIIDDCSSDKSSEIIKSFNDPRIEYHRNNINLGLTKSLNIGLQFCKGKFIARMDSDDISHPNRLASMLDFFSTHPEIDVCGSYNRLFGEIHFFTRRRIKYSLTHSEIFVKSIFSNPMAHSSVMWRANISTTHAPFYNENYKKAQDYYLWGSLLLSKYKFANIPKYLVQYRVSKTQISSTNKEAQHYTSDQIRAKLIHYLLPECSEEEIILHNKICNYYNCSSIYELYARKQWLNALKGRLVKMYPDNTFMINKIISLYWLISCASIQKGLTFKILFNPPSSFILYSIFNRDFLSIFFSRIRK